METNAYFIWKITCLVFHQSSDNFAFRGTDHTYYIEATTIEDAQAKFKEKLAHRIIKIEQLCLASMFLR